MLYAGYTFDGERKYFNSLLLGIREGDDLIFIGETELGFRRGMKTEIWEKIEVLKCKKCYFLKEPKLKNVFWIKPEISCEIRFLE
jgi:bifunctional non-homologous end joining protein LigD